MNDVSSEQLGSAEARALIGEFRAVMQAIRTEVAKVVVGQGEVVEHLLISLLVGGHCLITGMPGTAKTLLVRTLAGALGLTFKRIQFTPDLMPTDVTGTDIVEEEAGTGRRNWSFVAGPIFTNVLLADEINRTPPKTQSALLEAMQEHSVTVRGHQHRLDAPFLVLATQNPIELEGTYPLPEAQLDRFLFNVILDHLGVEEELAVIERFTTRIDLPEVQVCTSAAQLLKFQWLVRQVPVAEEVSRHAVQLVRMTRPEQPQAPEAVRSYIKFGASVRATMYLVLAAKARALLAGRYHVTESDLHALALPVLRHRVLTNYQAESHGKSVEDVLRALLSTQAR